MTTDGTATLAGVVTEALEAALARYAGLEGGRVADYIPQLATADPRHFGAGLVSLSGHRYAAGDALAPFTLQSLSKPFVYALALTELGPTEVERWVGAEPSGEVFDAISLEPGTGRPANPMINAGALVTTALVPGSSDSGFERVLAWLGDFAGRALEVDERVYASEFATADRNRALAYLLRGARALPGSGDVERVLAAYTRACAVRVTALDVATMAATLANRGVHPVTGRAVVPEPVVVQVLAVMASCGMYDGSGRWLQRVGLPAKSGVSGGILAVGPGRFGIAVYSPPLDERGNSVRGIALLEDLSERFGLHLMHTVPTPRIARAADRQHLAIDGDLDFAAVEHLVYALDDAVSRPGAGAVVVDLDRVTDVEPVAAALLRAALERLAARGIAVSVRDDRGRLDAQPAWTGAPGPNGIPTRYQTT